MPTLKTIKKSPLGLVATALALVGGAATSQPAEAGWKLCVKQQCTSAVACSPYYHHYHCQKTQVCKNTLVECPDGKEHVGTLNSTSDGGNF
jgi:hypothetical protein